MITVLHPTPEEQQIEKAKQEAETQARVQAAQEAVKAMDEQRKKAQEAADTNKAFGSSPSDHPVGTTTSDAEASGTTPSPSNEATSQDAAGKKEGTEKDEDDKLIEGLLDDRPNYFMPMPDGDV